MVVGMREIKFRALCDGELIYQSDTHSFNIGGPHGDECLAWLGFDLIGSKKIDKLEQYTGLKDINGKEIYEGDIVGGCQNDVSWVIEWGSFGDTGFYGCNQLNSCIEILPSPYGDNCATLKITDKNILECEVIGNIHENPELLEGL